MAYMTPKTSLQHRFFFKCSAHLWINNAISWSIKIYSTSYQSFILLCSLHCKTRFHFVPLFTQQNLDFRGSSFSCYNNHLLKKAWPRRRICVSPKPMNDFQLKWRRHRWSTDINTPNANALELSFMVLSRICLPFALFPHATSLTLNVSGAYPDGLYD